MGGRTTEQEYDEFEMLLGEIPNATSGNPQHSKSNPNNPSPKLEPISIEEDKVSSPASNFTDFYHSPRAARHIDNVAFYGDLSFSQSPFYLKLQSNGKLDNANSDSETPTSNVHQDQSNLPDEQSLTSAFQELSFKDGVTVKSTTPASARYNQTSPIHNLLVDGQYPTHLSKSLSRLDSAEVSILSLPATLNEVNISSPAFESYLPFPGANGVDKFNGKTYGQEFFKLNVHELKKQKPESLLGDLGEQRQSFPVYAGAMPANPNMHSFQLLPRVPVPGTDLQASAYQQQYYLNAQSPAYMPPQHLNQSHISWWNMEEERYGRMQQQYFCLQHLQNQGSEFHQIQKDTDSGVGSLTGSTMQSYFGMPLTHMIEQGNRDPYWNNNALHKGYNQLNFPLTDGSLRQCYSQGLYGKEESCGFPYSQKLPSAGALTCPAKDFPGHQVCAKVGKQIFPEKILTRSHGVNSLRILKSDSITSTQSPNDVCNNGMVFSNGNFHHPLVLNNRSFQLDGQNSCSMPPDDYDSRHASKLLEHKYNSVDEIVGRIYLVAKDQHGCRFLQKKFTEGNLDDIQKIFVEIADHVVELMTDPFGNYLVQKLLDVCNEDQKMHIFHVITRKAGELIGISCDVHGTRAVQKIIEILKTEEQSSMIVSSLKPGILSLMKDVNGNHVAQRFLQHLSPEYKEFLFDAAIAHCVDLATDRQGCCVLQKCLHHSDSEQKHRLISEITSNALVLSENQYGNYVVQYILDQKVPWATADVLDRLESNYGYLSTQKYSSNVVEKCLKNAGEDKRAKIIQELIGSPQFSQILQDAYGNYVIQSALGACKGALHTALVEAIRPHVPVLRNSPYGKKVLSCITPKK